MPSFPQLRWCLKGAHEPPPSMTDPVQDLMISLHDLTAAKKQTGVTSLR